MYKYTKASLVGVITMMNLLSFYSFSFADDKKTLAQTDKLTSDFIKKISDIEHKVTYKKVPLKKCLTEIMPDGKFPVVLFQKSIGQRLTGNRARAFHFFARETKPYSHLAILTHPDQKHATVRENLCGFLSLTKPHYQEIIAFWNRLMLDKRITPSSKSQPLAHIIGSPGTPREYRQRFCDLALMWQLIQLKEKKCITDAQHRQFNITMEMPDPKRDQRIAAFQKWWKATGRFSPKVIKAFPSIFEEVITVPAKKP